MLNRIEDLRQELEHLFTITGSFDGEVLAVSQKLDELINLYNKVLRLKLGKPAGAA